MKFHFHDWRYNHYAQNGRMCIKCGRVEAEQHNSWECVRATWNEEISNIMLIVHALGIVVREVPQEQIENGKRVWQIEIKNAPLLYDTKWLNTHVDKLQLVVAASSTNSE